MISTAISEQFQFRIQIESSIDLPTAGNIRISTDVLVAIENSDITANAQAGSGGQVLINADAIFGTQFRQQQSDASDITATSELGPEFSGSVELDTEIDTTQRLVELSRDVIDPAALIAQNPCQQGEESEFTLTGRGGLPPNPTQGTRQRSVSVGLTEPVESEEIQQLNSNRQSSSNPNSVNRHSQSRFPRNIVPARGWIRNENGDVILVSYDPTQTLVQRQRQPLPTCPQSSDNVEP